MYEELSSAMETLEPGDPKLNETLDMLKETHATSSGLKAFTTWSTLEAIDKARQACGGVGYSSYNAFAGMHADFAVQVSIQAKDIAKRGSVERLWSSSHSLHNHYSALGREIIPSWLFNPVER